MCGRFALINKLVQLKEEFAVEDPTFELMPNYNVAPSQIIIAVVRDEGKNKFAKFRWGLIPFWAKDKNIGYKLINARSETIAEKNSFKHAFKKRRCLIVASGFFEWKKVGKHKIPMYITMKSRKPLSFAGLWENWRSPEGEEIKSCTILTTNTNNLMEPIHNRMPAIMPVENREQWLDNSHFDDAKLSQSLVPYPDDEMEAWEVSKLVNSPMNNSEKNVKPVKPSNLF
ncbi:MAG: SOS response-associated peptidase [Planctomycetes bacterium]|nr:SOS response-associated peptidase [Planctomycetota bacterium]